MFVLDTNVVSELRKVRAGKGDPQVTSWSRDARIAELFLSAITIEELEIGVLLAERRDSAQGRVLRSWFDTYVLAIFDGRILPVTVEIARRSARLHVLDPKPMRDALIAATALTHGMAVVTRNTADFAFTGVKLIDPFKASRD
jgi:predicted nucleic acid-binding protein